MRAVFHALMTPHAPHAQPHVTEDRTSNAGRSAPVESAQLLANAKQPQKKGATSLPPLVVPPHPHHAPFPTFEGLWDGHSAPPRGASSHGQLLGDWDGGCSRRGGGTAVAEAPAQETRTRVAQLAFPRAVCRHANAPGQQISAVWLPDGKWIGKHAELGAEHQEAAPGGLGKGGTAKPRRSGGRRRRLARGAI